MEQNTEVGELEALSYDVTVSERSGTFYVYLPELSLVVCQEDLHQAYSLLKSEKTAYFKRMIEMGVADQVPFPARIRRRRAVSDGLLEFTLKSLILGIVIGLLILASVPFLDAFVVKRLSGVPRSAVLSFDKQAGRAFSRLEGLSEEDTEKLLQDLRNRVHTLRPFYQEVARLWDQKSVFPDSVSSKGSS